MGSDQGAGGSSKRVVTRKIPCGSGTGLLHNLSLLRGIDRYLHLDDRQVLLASQGEDGRIHVADATDSVGRSATLSSSIAFVEEEIGSMGMFELYGTWQGGMDIIVTHASGSDAVSVITPRDADDAMREELLREVRRAVRFVEGSLF